MYRNFFAMLLFTVLLLPVPARALYTFEDGNYWTPTIETIPDIHDPQQCASLCEDNPNCLVASYHSPFAPEGWAYKCVLRSAVGKVHREQLGIMSWVKPHDPQRPLYHFENANYWSPELETIPDLRDPQECARRCDQNPNCKIASFHGRHAPPGWAYKCILRSSAEDRHTDQDDIWSWVKP